MDSLKNRNWPFLPFSVNPVTEIDRPPYMRGPSSVAFFGGGSHG